MENPVQRAGNGVMRRLVGPGRRMSRPMRNIAERRDREDHDQHRQHGGNVETAIGLHRRVAEPCVGEFDLGQQAADGRDAEAEPQARG